MGAGNAVVDGIDLNAVDKVFAADRAVVISDSAGVLAIHAGHSVVVLQRMGAVNAVAKGLVDLIGAGFVAEIFAARGALIAGRRTGVQAVGSRSGGNRHDRIRMRAVGIQLDIRPRIGSVYRIDRGTVGCFMPCGARVSHKPDGVSFIYRRDGALKGKRRPAIVILIFFQIGGKIRFIFAAAIHITAYNPFN